MRGGGGYDVEGARKIEHELWPLGPVDARNGRFPCCLVWAPLPVVSWLAPFVGHVGICREDGTILDFAASNFINVDDFAFGSPARYLQLHREKCCLAEGRPWGEQTTWDEAVQASARTFESKSYNLFTCNCHSFVAESLNRLSYGGCTRWNMVSVAALVLSTGSWLGPFSLLRAFLPFLLALSLGLLLVGWSFLLALLSFSLLLLAWFLLASYCFPSLFDC